MTLDPSIQSILGKKKWVFDIFLNKQIEDHFINLDRYALTNNKLATKQNTVLFWF